MSKNGTPNGFYWEKWKGGQCVSFGWHDGTLLSGEDQTENFVTVCVAPRPFKGGV